MAWLSSSPQKEEAPDRGARASCWAGRDAYFACLDAKGVVDGAKSKECPKELEVFEKACLASWVTYFQKKRVMEHQRDVTLRKLQAEQGGKVDA
ncbi:hypothetical protein K470DRAFT_222638 [Piedraia hortae CBS 480.64]|uniref:Cytochrome c oxidase, subunit VIb n=1 Tax=Piedraia hortae CBS 480.64 TaxID=1314780 RepID=A0A6A7BSU0_9PEZI|nr:hypothetical protein K470DRAFT_222638 [Piedraia hortae CBS 480.64]